MGILRDLLDDRQRLIIPQAQWYAALGWRVVILHGIRESNGQPVCTCKKGADCPDPGKHPRLKGWPAEATCNEEKIAELWQRWPESNLGIRLGPTSGILDVEFDNDEGRATAERLLPESFTPTYNSKRSVHRLFAYPKGLTARKSVVKVEGLEIRLGSESEGAQSVVPPSIHASGVSYRWVTGLSPDDVEPQPFPAVLAELLAKTGEANALSNGQGFVCEGHFWETPGVSKGERTHTLWRLVGRYLAEYGANDKLMPWALAWAAKCDPPLEPAQVEKAVLGLTQKHVAKGTIATQPPTPQARPKLSLISKPYAEIQPEAVQWLWPERIALGKLSLLVGVPGLGKTFAACDLSARVSRGVAFPDGSPCVVGDAAILTAEDGAADTLRPRLDNAGADVAKVHHIEGLRASDGKEVFLSLGEHLAMMDEWLEQHPEVRLFVIDPISAFLGKLDSHNNSETRGVLGPVAKLAERHGVAIVGVTHMSKRETKTIHRVIGSVAFVAAARASWLVANDPDDESDQRRLFLPIKNNLGQASGLAFAIDGGRVVWETSPVFVSADEIDDDSEASPREEAKAWLQALLEDGSVPAAKVFTKAKAERIAERTLKRAKRELGIVSEKQGESWVWHLPQDNAKPEQKTLIL